MAGVVWSWSPLLLQPRGKASLLRCLTHRLPSALTGGGHPYGFVIGSAPVGGAAVGAGRVEKRNTTLTYKVLPKRHKYQTQYEKNFCHKKSVLKFDNSYIR